MAIRHVVPTSLLVLEEISFSDNDSSKGPLIIDKADKDSYNAQFVAHGKYYFDRDHGHTLAPEDADISLKVSYGEYDAYVDNNGLCFRNIQWTDCGEKMIEGGEYNCFSIACTFDKKTMKMKELINCALTNLPADGKARLDRIVPRADIPSMVARSMFDDDPDTELFIGRARLLSDGMVAFKRNDTANEQDTLLEQAENVGETDTMAARTKQSPLTEAVALATRSEEDTKRDDAKADKGVERDDASTDTDGEAKTDDDAEALREKVKMLESERDDYKVRAEEAEAELTKRTDEDATRADEDEEMKRSLLKNRSQAFVARYAGKSLAEVMRATKVYQPAARSVATINGAAEVKQDLTQASELETPFTNSPNKLVHRCKDYKSMLLDLNPALRSVVFDNSSTNEWPR